MGVKLSKNLNLMMKRLTIIFLEVFVNRFLFCILLIIKRLTFNLINFFVNRF